MSESVVQTIPFIQAVYQDNETGLYVLNEKPFEDLLNSENIKNKPVVIISVAGAFRKGKSFLLNFMIKYLRFLSKGSDDWMNNLESPLTGFPWRGGSERETTGILFWAEPFILKQNDEEIVVLLMDTQGAFDSNSSVKECAMVFAVSTMISSVQIYNITGNLQEDYLSQLQLFTEYGRLALENSETKPFQDLIFLIRDWPYPYEYEYGFSPTFLDKKLSVQSSQHREIQTVREHIKNCFEKVELFLLPHPGNKVATTPNFDGKLRDIDEEFRKYLQIFIETIISPEKLKPKKSQGITIKCSDVITFFRSYLKIFQSDVLPEPKNIIMATAEANNLMALNSARELYRESMLETCGGNHPFIPESNLNEIHSKNLTESLVFFNRFKKFGENEISFEFRQMLEREIISLFEEFKTVNLSKQVNSLKFILTAFIITLISFMISNLLDLIGLDFLMLPFQIVCFAMIALIIFCSYAQFYGGFSDYLHKLNYLQELLLEKIKTYAFNKYLNNKKD